MNIEKYIDFLKKKIAVAQVSGFEVDDSELSPCLFPHERDAVKWALRGGRRALFESFGLGKTIQQLEIMRLIHKREGGKCLIVCPLNVKYEFEMQARQHLGMKVEYVRNMKEVTQAGSNILITNYERVRDGDIDPQYFAATSLDEASVLRSYGSKTYQIFMPKFSGVKYKFVATATPSPNKFKELIHYGGYLEQMDTGQALTRFFKRDSTKANNLTLYEHKESEFWLWLSSWALFITKPSDLGYADTGYKLPEMKIYEHEVTVNHGDAKHDRDGNVHLFRDAAIGITAAAHEKRATMDDRIGKMLEIIRANPDDSFIIWHDLEDERRAIKKALPEAIEVYGSQDIEEREQIIADFSEGKIKYLATKPEISGSGCNFQEHCHKAIYLGIGYEFNDFIQSIHRIYRFLQNKQVEIHIIYAETERSILRTLQRKWKQHDYLTGRMISIIKEYGLSEKNILKKLERTLGVTRQEYKGALFTVVNNDNVIEMQNIESNSIGLIHTSIPFSNHYEYTPTYNDFGHNINNSAFFEQMDFLTPELLRVLKPGRVLAVHVKDRILFGNATGLGMPSVDFFHADCIKHYEKHGFVPLGMITIVTDVVRENNQTYRLGWTEMTKDGSKMGVGCPEYVLLFRKLPSDTSRAYADEPVVKSKRDYSRARWQIDAHAFWRSNGNRFMSPEEIAALPIDQSRLIRRAIEAAEIYDYKKHVETAETMDNIGKLPSSFMSVDPVSLDENVWDDVVRMRTLNSEQSQRNLRNHICPLQFDIVERIIFRYSNKGDVVLDPFGGLMTVPYMAVKMGRKGYGIELNADYYRDGLSYMKYIENQVEAPAMFDIVEVPS
jgi:DNA modification methylase